MGAIKQLPRLFYNAGRNSGHKEEHRQTMNMDASIMKICYCGTWVSGMTASFVITQIYLFHCFLLYSEFCTVSISVCCVMSLSVCPAWGLVVYRLKIKCRRRLKDFAYCS